MTAITRMIAYSVRVSCALDDGPASGRISPADAGTAVSSSAARAGARALRMHSHRAAAVHRRAQCID